MKGISDIIAAWVTDFEQFFQDAQTDLNKQVRSIEGGLYRAIIADMIPALKMDGSRIANTVANLGKANMVERVFDQAGRDEINTLLSGYANYLLEVSGKNAEYYYAIGIDKAKVSAVAKDIGYLRKIIGISENGSLATDGFLYRIGRADNVREAVKQYVLTSISTGRSLKDFQGGLKEMMQGRQGVNGVLMQYWDNYAYDQFSRVREISNLHFKEETGLKHFVYQGGVIRTSRAFCVKKNGKAFSEEEAIRNWPNDPDLIDKAHIAQYNPLVDRGRHNCRHFLMWISKDKYEELKAKQK